jgi:hypothetical protein
MANPEHSIIVMKRHCERAGLSSPIRPAELLAYLLEALKDFHTLRSVDGFAQSADNRSNVYSEIQGIMQLSNTTEIPKDLLATMLLLVRRQQWVDRHEANTHKVAGTIRKADVGETLILIIQDLLNQSEAVSIKDRLILEELERKGEIKLFRPLDQPPPPEDGKPRA